MAEGVTSPPWARVAKFAPRGANRARILAARAAEAEAARPGGRPAAWVYCRVSTGQQAADGSGLVDQEARGRQAFADRFASTHAFREVVTDPGVSGTLAFADRPGGARVLAEIREGDVLIVPKVDRLSRSMRDGLKTVASLTEMKVRVVLLDVAGHDLDVSTPVGWVVLTIMLWQAENWLVTHKERVTAGQRARRMLGTWRSPGAPYGFKKDPAGGPYLPDPEWRAFVRTLAELWRWGDAQGWGPNSRRYTRAMDRAGLYWYKKYPIFGTRSGRTFLVPPQLAVSWMQKEELLQAAEAARGEPPPPPVSDRPWERDYVGSAAPGGALTPSPRAGLPGPVKEDGRGPDVTLTPSPPG